MSPQLKVQRNNKHELTSHNRIIRTGGFKLFLEVKERIKNIRKEHDTIKKK